MMGDQVIDTMRIHLTGAQDTQVVKVAVAALCHLSKVANR